MSEAEADGSDVLDVAIVGGGVSGVYTAWRLLTADLGGSKTLRRWASGGRRLKVAVFEGSGRIGGRLLSARPPGMPHVTCEIGGMRYVSSQTLVKSLVENVLKLPRKEQVVDDPRNVAFLRGKYLRVGQLGDPSALPYQLSASEASWLKGNGAPSALIGWAINQILPGVQDLHGEELRSFLNTAEVDGSPLYQHGFWNLLARAMTTEAYQLSRTTVGYDSLGANANAADLASEYFDFTPGVKYYLIDGGYDRVPWTLEQKVKDGGGQVVKGAWLESFDAADLGDGEAGVALRFHDGRPEVRARAVILAMPRRSLELLRPVGPVLDPVKAPHVQFLMNSVEPIPLYKLCIAYPNPWWESFGVTQGRSLTDAPVRQCYYWAVEGREPGADPKNQNAVIMAYNDETSVSFWGGMRRLPLGVEDARMPNFLKKAATPPGHGPRARVFRRQPMPHASRAGAAPGDDLDRLLRQNWDDHVAPEAMVREIHRQLMTLHDSPYAPEPLDAAFMDWSDDPYGGGVHFWNPGYQSAVILDRMTQPVADFPCYICGEAYSTNQSWVEGALQTAEIVLQKRLGLAAPDWVTP